MSEKPVVITNTVRKEKGNSNSNNKGQTNLQANFEKELQIVIGKTRNGFGSEMLFSKALMELSKKYELTKDDELDSLKNIAKDLDKESRIYKYIKKNYNI